MWEPKKKENKIWKPEEVRKCILHRMGEETIEHMLQGCGGEGKKQ